ncbi:MAG TPA: prohibitin family protein [Pseudolabrys sp.]|nr:prohibitin family protein [Pseudolabrys sp.]
MPPPQPRTWWGFVSRHLPSLSITLLAALLVTTILFPYVVITVPSGSVGVLWKRFNGYDFYCWCFVGRGTLLDPRELRDEGLHVIWPWDKLYIYTLRLQSSTQTYNAITKDGVSVNAQINMRFQLVHNYVGVLHKFIGPQYVASVVEPELGSRAREVISQYTAQDVYTSREAIQGKIRAEAQKSLSTHLNNLVQPEAMEQPDPKHYSDFLQNSIQLLDSLVLSIELPPEIVAAINRQTQQFYEIQEYKYRVEREAQESTRKQIEANGIAAFQRTVSEGISDSYLRWRGIEATLALAQSRNSKIVIIGGGKDGLPVILGNIDNAAGASSRANAVEEEATPNEKTSTISPGQINTLPRLPGASPAGTDKNNAAAVSSTPPDVTQTHPPPAPSSSLPLDLSQIKNYVPRLPDWLRSTTSGSGSGTGAPKQ